MSSFDRPNIRLQVVEKHNPQAQLKRFLAAHEDEAGIVYCSTRKRTEEVAAHLRGRGIAAAAYHAGLPAEERERVQEAFIFDQIQIVAATVAFGMGIDKTNVRFVVHWDLPQHLEGYYQEIGRSGRDGLPAEALLLFGWEDVPRVRALIETGENEERVAVEQHKFGAMVGFTQALSCRRRVLLGYLGERMETGLRQLRRVSGPSGVVRRDRGRAEGVVVRLPPGRAVRRGARGRRAAGLGEAADRRLGHDRLSTYGIGADVSVDAWRSSAAAAGPSGLSVSGDGAVSGAQADAGRDAGAAGRGDPDAGAAAGEGGALRGAAREGDGGPGARRAGRGGAAGAGDTPGGPLAGRTTTTCSTSCGRCRRQIAEREGLPAYVIFHDSTLREMAEARPAGEDELLEIGGVGERKLEKYGDEFLALLTQWGDAGEE